jgi:predicted lysophospholipase L1 biosynthesis ABC-type transport system permease subunit
MFADFYIAAITAYICAAFSQYIAKLTGSQHLLGLACGSHIVAFMLLGVFSSYLAYLIAKEPYDRTPWRLRIAWT